MAPPDAYARRRGAARPPREGRRGQRSPSRLVAAPRTKPQNRIRYPKKQSRHYGLYQELYLRAVA